MKFASHIQILQELLSIIIIYLMESEIDILTTNEGRSKLMSFAQKVSKNSEALLNYIYSKLPK